MKKWRSFLSVFLILFSFGIANTLHVANATSPIYKVTSSSLNVRTGSSTKYKKVGVVRKGQKLSVVKKETNGWYKIKYKNKNRYVNGKYVQVEKASTPEFSNVKKLDKSIVVDLRYNGTNNFTKKRIYNFNQAILRTSTAKKLIQANGTLKKHGYVLKIWDAYRPYKAQESLWKVYPNPTYVAKPDPNNIRGHMLGATIDVTLCTLSGKEIKMQSTFDDFSILAHRNYKRTNEQEKLYQLLDKAMSHAGFVGYQNEWWHYSDRNQNFKPIQVDPRKY
ncbi:M15 family metallopeptidase [Bacillus sp. AL-1R]